MKGKKFDAVEKHFEKRRVQYESKIKDLEEQVKSAHREKNYFKSNLDLCERENRELKDWVERLLEYTELSKEDIRKVCEKDKKAAETVEWLKTFSKCLFPTY
jgi:archaellum component FlaC